MRKPRVDPRPGADHYAMAGEKIIEYSYPDGTSETPGGLISFRWAPPPGEPDAEPVLNVTLYRHDAKVRVHVSS